MSRYRSKVVRAITALVLLSGALMWLSQGISATHAACPTPGVCISNKPSVALTLNGHNKTVSYKLTFILNNKSTSGWNVTISATQFKSGSHALPLNASKVKSMPVASCRTGTCINPASPGTISYPVTIPITPVMAKFYNAQAGTGIGSFKISAPISTLVPGNTYAGIYTSTITIALVSGP